MIGEKAWEYSLWEGLSGPIHFDYLGLTGSRLVPKKNSGCKQKTLPQ